ncbi:MAG TPA: type-F conjugative transfer system pilin assembly protein TrbC [Candidatus Babeliales bacterium]|nr:type-F conjugative transfer system pilin assembly protein TrbC [Candidatus Babeliales bacterium]
MIRITQLIIVSILAMVINSICYGASESNVLVFVSFSMPQTSIKGWMNEAEKIHAPVVIRGLVNNSFKATIQKMTELASDNHGGVQLDPTLFKTFNIKQVPAVVVTNNANCLPNQTCTNTYDVVYGDVHLDYALEKIARQNDELSSIAQTALATIRENHHA